VIVVDSSAIVEVLLGSPAAALRLADEQLIAPYLVDPEVGNALRRRMLKGRISAEQFHAGLRDFAEMEIERHPHDDFLDRAWELRDNVTFYDAMYVALAEALDVPLVTLDGRLRNAPGIRCTIEVVAAIDGV
jgi:predicted nucleic acid-binding protein